MPAVNFNQVVRASSFTSPQSLAATSQLTIVFDMLEVCKLPPVDATTMMAAAAAVGMAPGQPPRRDEPSRSRAGWWFLGGAVIVLLVVGAYLLNGMLFDSAPQRDAVPNIVGMTEDDARVAIADAGFRVGQIGREPSETVEADLVIAQDPNRDVFADPGTSIDFTLSVGRPEVQVASVVGSLRKDARTQLIAQGLKVRFVAEDSDENAHQVLSTNPPAGPSVAEGYPIPKGETSWQTYLNAFLKTQQRNGVEQFAYEKYVLGKHPPQTEARWCIARDVLGWMDRATG